MDHRLVRLTKGQGRLERRHAVIVILENAHIRQSPEPEADPRADRPADLEVLHQLETAAVVDVVEETETKINNDLRALVTNDRLAHQLATTRTSEILSVRPLSQDLLALLARDAHPRNRAQRPPPLERALKSPGRYLTPGIARPS
jgi:hypothetical protein